MILSNIKILRFLSNSLFIGLPFMAYNPINKVPVHAPLYVEEGSTYLNFKLDKQQTDYLNTYISEYNSNLSIVPIEIDDISGKSSYLSVNIYNCSSPLFMTNKTITRCEINTYVIDNNNIIGTLILDYLCNDLSMDPVNIFKLKSNVHFKKKDIYHTISCNSLKDKINLKLNFTKFRDIPYVISDSLIDYTDNIFYKNGILDKIYYDTSLVKAITKSPKYVYNFSFIYRDLTFSKIDSFFYFTNKIQFVGSMWDNLYKI